MNPKDPRHGTDAGYQAHHDAGQSPCEPCMVANRRARKLAQLRLNAGIRHRVPLGQRAWQIIHDTPRGALRHATGMTSSRLCEYDKGGPDQIVHIATRQTILRAGKVRLPTNAGLQRRLQALTAIGYSAVHLATLMGIDLDAVKVLRGRKTPPKFVRDYFAAAIVDVYDELSMRPVPGDRRSNYQRAIAKRNSWAPPLSWDDIDDPTEQPQGRPKTRDYHARGDIDEAVVLRLLAGERMPCTPAEKVEVVARWAASGRPLAALEERLGWKPERYTPANMAEAS